MAKRAPKRRPKRDPVYPTHPLTRVHLNEDKGPGMLLAEIAKQGVQVFIDEQMWIPSDEVEELLRKMRHWADVGGPVQVAG